MKIRAKASSAGSTMGRAKGLGRIVHGAFALRATSRRADGSSAPFTGVALLAALGILLVLPATALADTTPSVSGESASDIGVTTAKLSGQVNPNGTTGDGNTTWRLQWSPVGTDHGVSGDENWSNGHEGTIEAPASEEASNVGVEALLGFSGELQPGQQYEFRLQAENAAGQDETASPYPTFTMDPAVSPVLTIDPVTDFDSHNAQLKGTIDPEGGNVNPIGPEVMAIHWELQLLRDGDPNGWQTVASADLNGAEAQGTSPITVQVDATGLYPNAHYEARLHASSTNFGSFSVEADSPGTNPSFDTPALAPSIGAAGLTEPGQTSFVLAATVNPNNDPLTDCHFAYGVGNSFNQQAPCAGRNEVQQVAIPTAVESGQFKLTFEGQQTEDIDFDATAATVRNELEALSTIGAGNVGVKFSPSDCCGNKFYTITFRGSLGGKDVPALSGEDGTEPLVGGAPPRLTVSGNVNQGATALEVLNSNPASTSGVTALLSGLTPDTDYSFRLLATNATGTSEGDPRSFHTLAKGSEPGACPNQVIREEQHSTALGECRAFEMVSPPDKNGGDVAADNPSFTAAVDGNAIAYLSRASFGDTIGSGSIGQTTYIARRGPAGWSNHGISPTPKFNAAQIGLGTNTLMNFSADLSRVVIWGLDIPGVPGGQKNMSAIYSEDTLTRQLQLVSTPLAGPTNIPTEFAFATTSGVSRDSRHIAFRAISHLLPEAPQELDFEGNLVGVPSVYEWDNGTLRLASILPDGTPATEGVKLAAPNPEGYRETVSPDGSRVLFNSSNQLYMRVDHTSTVLASESENPSFSGPAEEVVLQQMTGDSRHVIFDTTSPLLSADQDSGPDLYLYTDGPDPAHEDSNLTLISDTGDVPAYANANTGTTSVVGSSDDASRIYYYNGSFLLWEGGTTTTVGGGELDNDASLHFAATASSPSGARVSPDGRYLAYFKVSGSGPGDFYLYDAESDTLRCVSCPSPGEPTVQARIVPNATNIGPGQLIRGVRPRFLADDGRVFFSTPERLVVQDTNGVGDAYQYDPATGEVTLLSSGTGTTNSAFFDASPSGDDVFIATRQQLVGSDPDSFVDIYDVRVDGGYPEPRPVPAPCEGEACQSPGATPPTAASVASSQSGPGNPKPNPPCARKRNKARCSKKAKHHKRGERRRAADANRRAAK